MVASTADAVAPANDNLTNAEVVAGALPLTVAGTTFGADPTPVKATFKFPGPHHPAR